MAISIGTALLGSAALGIGGSIYAADQASSAADVSAQAAADAADISQQQYEQTREDLAPWREVGEQALYQYADLLGIPPPGATTALPVDYSAFEQSPGYQFRMDQGIKAIERSAASKGLLQSGGTAKALQDYGQGTASQTFNDYMNQLAGAAGVGQTATTTTAVLGAEAAQQAGSSAEQEALARSSGYLGQAQAGAEQGS
jgi:hypothetical protein